MIIAILITTILLFVFVGSLILCYLNYREVYDSIAFLVGVPLILLTLPIIIAVGILTYSGSTVRLSGLQATAEAACNGVRLVKDSHYDNGPSPENAIVQGSIENLQQSSEVSEAARSCIKAKMTYNSTLAKYQASRRTTFTKLFTNGVFVSSSVDELEPLP